MQALLKPKEVAEILRVHPITIKRWAEAGRIEVVWLPEQTFSCSGKPEAVCPANMTDLPCPAE